MKGIKPKTDKRCTHNCSSPADWCPSLPHTAIGLHQSTSPSSYTGHNVLGYSTIKFGQFRSGVLDMSPHSFFCTCSLADYGKLKSPWLGVSTTEKQPKFQCVTNTILIVNTEQSTAAATKKEMNPIPPETRAGYKLSYSSSWGAHPEIFKVGQKNLTWRMFWQRKCHYWLDLASSLSMILIFLFLMLIQ